MAAAAAAAQAAQDLQHLEDCLETCGLNTQGLRNGVTVREGYVSLRQFSRLRPNEIPSLAKNLRQRSGPHRVHYSDNQIRALSALSFWLNEQRETGQPLDPVLWTLDKREEIEDRIRAEDEAPETKSSISDIKTFNSIEYDICIDGLRNHMRQHKLGHFVRDSNPPTTFADAEEQRLYSHRFDTTQAKTANKVAYRILKQYLVNTDGYSWIKPFEKTEDGRAAFLALDAYYSGDGEFKKRVAHAKAQLEKAHWKAEATFPFEKFVSTIRSAFATLDKKTQTKNILRRGR